MKKFSIMHVEEQSCESENALIVSDVHLPHKSYQTSGTIVLEGLYLPMHPKIDPLGKIWSSVRKRVFRDFGVDTVGIFFYNSEQKNITCNFLLNFGILDETNTKAEDYIKAFDDCYDGQIDLFERVLIQFIEAEDNGYNDYIKVVESDISPEKGRELINNILNNFLIGIGLKMPKNS